MAAPARQTLRRLAIGAGASGAGAVAAAALLPLGPPSACAGPEGLPRFSLAAPRFDQSTYAGRLLSVLDRIDPRTLLTTEAEVRRCQALLEDFRRSGALPAGRSDAEMWQARKTVEAVIHPVSKEPMFVLGRMSAFVPMNVPVCAIMLNSRSTPAVIFSQWLNQSYNVVNNYVNRSSLEVDWTGLLQPYCLAVTVSCAIALAGRRAVQALPSLARCGLLVPYVAVVSAGACNVAFTRMDEWAGRGVCIFSEEGEELGMSVKAGQQAVAKTIATRSVCLPIPALLLPPLVMRALALSGAAAVAAELCVITACFSLALPCALAILPMEMELATALLEPEYRALSDSQGRPITRVFANKGL